MRQELRQRRARAQPQHINVPRLQNFVDRRFKHVDVDFVHRRADVLHIRLKHLGQHLRMVHIRGHFKPLRRREPVPDQFLQRLLKLRIALVSQRGGKTHHRGFRNAHILSQLGRRHKSRFIIMLHNALGNPPVALGQFFPALIQPRNQFLRVLHGSHFLQLPALCRASPLHLV